LKRPLVPKPKKFCGACRWYEETRPFIGRCLKYNIMTRMENYKFACVYWAPLPGIPGGGHPASG
jgi:hypothetical protein